MQLQEEFGGNLKKIVELGVGLVLVDRGISDSAEDILTDAGVMAVQRVANKELRKAAEHTAPDVEAHRSEKTGRGTEKVPGPGR
jgi:chaperonin GroEL (HSP60 family)